MSEKLKQDGTPDLRTVSKLWRPPRYVVVVSQSVRVFAGEQCEQEAKKWIQDHSDDRYIQHHTYVFER